MMNAVSLKAILFSKFIKYDTLNTIIGKSFCDRIPGDIINVYIDMYQFLISLYQVPYTSTSPFTIASTMINLAIHFRNFFRKHGKYANIFIVYSPTISAHNTQYCPEWNSYNTNTVANKPTVTQEIIDNVSMMDILIPYLPDIYFRTGTFEVCTIIGDMIQRFSQKGFAPYNIVVSTSRYAYQLPAYMPNTFLLVKKKSMKDEDNRDKSYLVSSDTHLISSYIRAIGKKSDVELDKNAITAAMILLGIPKRNISSLISTKNFISLIQTMQDTYTLPTIENIISCMIQSNIYGDISSTTLINRYKCIDLGYQMSLYNTMPESKITSYLNQLQDIGELNNINQKYFADDPLSLDLL